VKSLRRERLDRLKQGNAPAIILRGIWLRTQALATTSWKLFLRKVVAPLFPDRVLIKTVRLLNIYDDNSYDGSVDSVHDFTLVSRYKEYAIEDAREREYLAHGRFSNGKIYSVTSFVCTIDNACFRVGDGVVCTSDNHLIVDSTCDEGRLARSSAYGQLIPHPVYLAGTYSTVWNMYADNHFHWLFESLPRLYSLKVATDEPFTLLMPRDLRADYKATLFILSASQCQGCISAASHVGSGAEVHTAFICHHRRSIPHARRPYTVREVSHIGRIEPFDSTDIRTQHLYHASEGACTARGQRRGTASSSSGIWV